MNNEKIRYMICNKEHVSVNNGTEDCLTMCQYCGEETDFSDGDVCLFIMKGCEVYFCNEKCLDDSWGQFYDFEKVKCLPEYESLYEDLEK